MELEELGRIGLAVHKDLVRELVTRLEGAGLASILTNEVVANETIFSLLVARAGWVTLRGLLGKREGEGVCERRGKDEWEGERKGVGKEGGREGGRDSLS